MGIIEELKVFLHSILWGVVMLLVLTFGLFIFPTGNSVTVQVFNKIERELLPPDVHLVVTNPLAAFTSQMWVAFILAFIILFPFFLYKIIRYISPALLEKERRMLLRSLIPTTLLFFLGCAVAYLKVIPKIFEILYPYATEVGALSLFSISEFTSIVLSLMLIIGLMFLLPVFMVLLSSLGLISSEFWRSKIRHAIVFFLIFTAITVPDPTGTTMLILTGFLTVLYLMGYILTRHFKHNKI